MTKEKAMKILSNAFNNIFGEISLELDTKRSDIVEKILLARDIGTIRSLVHELDTIDKALSDIDRRKDYVNACIKSTDQWYDWSLLCDINKAFCWLPPEDEAE